jgi:hypothetical protein
MTANEIVDMLNKMLNKLNNNEIMVDPDDVKVTLPVTYSEDNSGNINFDTDSMREQFEELMFLLDRHNEETDFNWED